MARVLPDVDLMLVTLLRVRLDAEVTVANLRPDDFLDHLPMVTARRIPGAGPPANWRHRDTALVDIQTWATDPLGAAGGRRAASDLADQVLAALHAAADHQTVLAGLGSIRRVTATGPGELRDSDQPGRLHRFQASATVSVRPPRAP